MHERLEKIKTHLQENKEIYVAAAVGAGLGAAAVAATLLLKKQVVIVDSFKIQWKSNTTNHVVTTLVRRGHPGYLVRCLQTGEVFASQNRAAAAMGINRGDLSSHLNGKYASAGGYVFERLGEAS